MPRRRQSTTTAPTTPAPTVIQPLLFSRKQTATLLGCSISMLLRLESSNDLTPIKLNRHKPNACVFYASTQVHALASGR